MLKEYITLKDIFDIPGLQDHIGELVHTFLYMVCNDDFPELHISCSIPITREDLLKFVKDECHPFVCQAMIDIDEE